MKRAYLTTAILLSLSLTACSDDNDTVQQNPDISQPPISQPEPTPPTEVEPEVPVEEVPIPEIYLDENFDQLTTLPGNWIVPKNNTGTVYIKNGDLHIDGRAHNTQMTRILLPETFQKLRNYRIDMEFSFEESNNTGRWGSIIYRGADQYADPSFTPYYQFAMREVTTAASGLELALRMPNNTWNVLQKSAHSTDIGIQKKQKATVIVHGSRVRHYLNDELVLDSTLPYNLDQGGIGLSTAGLLMKVSHLKVTEQLEALPDSNKVTDLVNHALPVSMAPTLAQALATTGNVSPTATHVVYHLNAELNINNLNRQKVTTLQSYLKDATRQTLPLFNITDEKTIHALKAISQDYDLADITLMSTQPELLRKERIALPMLHTALDYSKVTNLTNSRKDIVTIANNTNSSLSKIVILPPQLLNRETVSHLQRLLITPWAKQDDANPLTAARILATGINGVYSSHPEVYHDLMKRMAPNTLLRKPLITGHRGIPALDDENTLEGILKAIKVGADAVEYDIYLTKDGHVVLMHDTTITRTTGIDRNIEDMTLAEVRQLRTLGYSRAVPTMDEVLAAVKKHPHITNFIEVKSDKPEIIPKIKELLDKHDAYDQAIVISFSGDQILNMKNVLPGVSTGFLTSTPAAQSDLVNTRRILDATQKYSSTFNPSFGGLSKELMHMASQRGVTFWPWTFRLNKDDFNRMYVQGTHGLTTDYAHDSSNFIVKLNVPKQVTATVGKALEIQGKTVTQVGTKSNYVFKNMLVLPNSTKYNQTGQGLTFTQKGTAYVMPSYTYTIAPNYNYTIYAEPVTVTVQ
ncbi:MAG: glycerophosphodiester phosphodiesterase family protein [Acinetobacter sp.]